MIPFSRVKKYNTSLFQNATIHQWKKIIKILHTPFTSSWIFCYTMRRWPHKRVCGCNPIVWLAWIKKENLKCSLWSKISHGNCRTTDSIYRFALIASSAASCPIVKIVPVRGREHSRWVSHPNVARSEERPRKERKRNRSDCFYYLLFENWKKMNNLGKGHPIALV